MSSPEAIRSSADPVPIFAALGDATRLEIVSRLSDGQPRSIAELTGGLDLTRQGVTKHLRVLEGAGIVTGKRVGRERRFVFSPAPISEASLYLDRVSRQWDDALMRLRAFVEDSQDS